MTEMLVMMIGRKRVNALARIADNLAIRRCSRSVLA